MVDENKQPDKEGEKSGQDLNQDRRKSLRLKKSIFLQHLDKKKYIWFDNSVKDFSETGACFGSDYIFAPNEELELRIKLPNDPKQILELKAKVIESKKYFTRVLFLDVKDEHKELIRSFINWYLNKRNIII